MNKYQITHYWSDENTFPEHIEQYTIKAKNEDNAIKYIKSQYPKEIAKEINDQNCDPITLGLDLYTIPNTLEELTYTQFVKQYPEIDLSDNDIDNEQYPYIRFYGWEINQIEN